MANNLSYKRNYNIDFLKGLLIITVVLGHIIIGPVRDTFSRYIIYSFHMPLFIAISGFLIPFEKLKNTNFICLVKKYLNHIIIPWIIAINVYHFVINRPPDNLSNIPNYINEYIYPFYHLWFVIGFLFYVFFTWALLKSGMSVSVVFMVSLIISIVSRFCNFNSENGSILIFQYLEYDLRLYNYVFFILGMLIRKYFNCKDNKTKSILKVSSIFSCISFLIVIILFFTCLPVVEDLMFFGLNFPLIIFLLLLCIYNYLPRNKLLEFIGRNSYAIYLWHILGKELATSLFGRKNLLIYYTANLIIFILEIAVIKLLSKIKIVNNYLFGNK